MQAHWLERVADGWGVWASAYCETAGNSHNFEASEANGERLRRLEN
jgi:hypothetical protein